MRAAAGFSADVRTGGVLRVGVGIVATSSGVSSLATALATFNAELATFNAWLAVLRSDAVMQPDSSEHSAISAHGTNTKRIERPHADAISCWRHSTPLIDVF